MSLLRECMDEAMGVVVDTLGDACVLTNAANNDTTPVQVIIRTEVEIYENHMLVGIATTGVFDLAASDPRIGDYLDHTTTGKRYRLDGIKAETASKREFILGEI